MHTYDSNRTQQQVYDELYSRSGKGSYVGGEHGAGTDEFILPFKSFLDVGCGMTQLIARMAKQSVQAVGCDISSVVVAEQCKMGNKVIWADVTESLPFVVSSFEVVSAYDVLEHIPPYAVNHVIDEIARVAKHRVLLTIAYKPANAKGAKGEPLHLTIQPEEWWIKQWERVGKVEIVKRLKGIRRGKKAWGTAIMVTL